MMTRNGQLILVGVLATTLLTGRVLAAEPVEGGRETSGAAKCENAAVVYWQAFEAMPVLDLQKEWEPLVAASEAVDGPISPAVKRLVKRFDWSLQEIQRAQRVAYCDWQIGEGPFARLVHLQKGRILGHAAGLKARLQFADGQSEPALANLLANLRLARDCGSSPLLVSMAIDWAIERDAIGVLAANLPQLSPQQLEALAASLKQLPPTPSLADCVRMENRDMGGWVERRVDAEVAKWKDPQAGGKIVLAIFREMQSEVEPKADDTESERRRELIQSMTVAEVREALQQMRSDYEALAKIAALPYAEQSARWATFGAGLAEAKKLKHRDDLRRIFSVDLLSAFVKRYDREEEMLARRELLALAVKVQAHGPDALKGATVLGQPNVEYKKSANGFELKYVCAGSKRELLLKVGK